ncbi:MAG: GNAT family N-acetyltransferase [Caldisericia bacterium]|nr:GNAT family N-acetyltransferase [Caldisericia bacterium]MDD4614391.1 GNAT family N-acetyltransferase [Caldisericia bacterium]
MINSRNTFDEDKTFIRLEQVHDLKIYSKISIAFWIEKILQIDLQKNGLQGIPFHESSAEHSVRKIYDQLPKNSPLDWEREFDTKKWHIVLAYIEDKPVAGAILIHDSPEINMLCSRKDLAVLWDIRVNEEYRGMGIGTVLFHYAMHWSKNRGAQWLKIETQNTNFDACKFYKKMGCYLGGIDCFAYGGTAKSTDEIMLLWYKEL